MRQLKIFIFTLAFAFIVSPTMVHAGEISSADSASNDQEEGIKEKIAGDIKDQGEKLTENIKTNVYDKFQGVAKEKLDKVDNKEAVLGMFEKSTDEKKTSLEEEVEENKNLIEKLRDIRDQMANEEDEETIEMAIEKIEQKNKELETAIEKKNKLSGFINWIKDFLDL